MGGGLDSSRVIETRRGSLRVTGGRLESDGWAR